MRQAVRQSLAHEDYDNIPWDEAQFVNDYDVRDMRNDLRWERYSEWSVAEATRK